MTIGVPLDAFLSYLVDEMSWDIPVSSITTFDADLCLDSISRFELLCVVEDLGVPLDESRIATWETLGDVYEAYIDALPPEGMVHQSEAT